MLLDLLGRARRLQVEIAEQHGEHGADFQQRERAAGAEAGAAAEGEEGAAVVRAGARLGRGQPALGVEAVAAGGVMPSMLVLSEVTCV